MRMIPISVVIPTYNRTKVLFDTIRSLCSGSKIPDEIIVVDQTNPPIEFPQDIQTIMKTGLLQVFHADIPSSTRSRNIGLEKAKNEIVLFCDDDILVGGGRCKHFMVKCATIILLLLQVLTIETIFYLTAN